MSSAFRYTKLVGRFAWGALAAAVIAALVFAVALFRLPSPMTSAGPPAGGTPNQWAAAVPLDQCAWSVFQTTDGKNVPEAGPLSQRFRLAGTLIWLDPDGTEIKKAILADLQDRTEDIVNEGDLLGSIEVLRIQRDSALLRDRVGGQEEELFLTYTLPAPGPEEDQPPPAAPEGLELSEEELVISTNRFGAQVGETRWVMSRDSVMAYVDEMSEHPARVLKLFDSMKPVYEGAGPARQVSGYVLQVEGEADFYRDVGLKEGDIVRSVNNLPMQSQHRAVFWIDQFRANNANAFQIDVERDGKAVRLEYLVR